MNRFLRQHIAQLRQCIRCRLYPNTIILLYHRIANLDGDPYGLFVSPEHFKQHLEVIKHAYSPMKLAHIGEKYYSLRKSPPRIVITFDDGYADNLHHAKPLLEQYDIPATVFIATGLLNQQREFWWDELGRIFLQPGTLPEHLTLHIREEEHYWMLATASHYELASYERDCHWSLQEKSDPTPRHLVFRQLYPLLYPLSHGEQQTILATLREWGGISPQGRTSHRIMTEEEVALLASGELIEIGAHTVTHPHLASLPPSLQQVEIIAGKKRLEEILNQSVTSFSYPYGARRDYTAETVQLVKDIGFERACSNFSGIIRQSIDCFQLPRFCVLNWPGEEFSSLLKKWFHF